MKRARAIIRLASGAALLPWVLGGCNAPTLPLPPPELDKLQQPAVVELQPDRDSVRIAGDGAMRTGDISVVMLNEELGIARFVRPDSFGHYDGLVPVVLECAQSTNHVTMWQRRDDGADSPIIIVTVPRNAPLPTDAGCSDAGEDAVTAPSSDAGTDQGRAP